MSYLVYCVLNGRRAAARPTLGGVRAQTVWVLKCHDLCAALSDDTAAAEPGSEPKPAPQVDHLLAYVKVVEAFNRVETVVPMRFGCRFRAVSEVRTWLRRNAAQLRALLQRVDGCVEMGVRALLLETRPPASPARAAADGARTGSAYLAARRIELAPIQRCDRIAQRLRDALSGRFRECIAEIGGASRPPMASLNFLVERGGLHAFREAFDRIAETEAALMLSGPWPPYNFVCAALTGAEEAPLLEPLRSPR
jgi:hypothetical protein